MNFTKKTITISEIFGPTLQGEGPLIGRPTLFVRTGGCDFRCTWCDSMHAVDEKQHGDEWEEMEPEAVMEQLLDLSGGFPMLVTLSGGNPAMQPLEELIKLGHNHGYTFGLETQGTIARDWFGELDHLVLSPKGPSSGMPWKEDRFRECFLRATDGPPPHPEVSVKVVVFDEPDYDFARRLNEVCKLPIYLQAGTEAIENGTSRRSQVQVWDILTRMEWLIARAAKDRWTDVTILPQLHVLIWGDERGV